MRKHTAMTIILTAILAQSLAATAAEAKKSNIMIIGDSISIGYHASLVPMMTNSANVFHCPGNACATILGVKEGKMETYLNSEYDGQVRKWDVVVFNYGIWNLKRTDLATYEKHLEVIADRIQALAPQAKVIWANTTVVPSETNAVNRSVPFNDVARKVMTKRGIPECDLHTLTAKFDNTCSIPNNVHFTRKGYEEIAKAVKAKIEQELGAKR
jgi:lysophospholipase L1-like esterase